MIRVRLARSTRARVVEQLQATAVTTAVTTRERKPLLIDLLQITHSFHSFFLAFNQRCNAKWYVASPPTFCPHTHCLTDFNAETESLMLIYSCMGHSNTHHLSAVKLIPPQVDFLQTRDLITKPFRNGPT